MLVAVLSSGAPRLAPVPRGGGLRPRAARAPLVATSSSVRGPSARRGPVSARAVLDVDESTFEAEVLKSDVPVLVDFWATWCGPCKLVAPLMAAVEKDFGSALKVVKINADPAPALVEKYKVYGLPTLIIFKGGAPVPGSQREGAINKAKLMEYLASHGLTPAGVQA